MPENIAQLELTLLKFESIEHIFSEVIERAKDNKRIKLVVRIFDTHGRLTRHVQAIQVLKIRTEAFYQWFPADFHTLPRWRRWVVNWRRRQTVTKSANARKRLIELSVEALRETIRQGGPIGIEEYPGAPFRLAHSSELYEILETAQCAKSVWAFIFKPNELLADRNTVIARAM